MKIPVSSFTEKHWNFHFANRTVLKRIAKILAKFYVTRRDILLDQILIFYTKNCALCYHKKFNSVFLWCVCVYIYIYSNQQRSLLQFVLQLRILKFVLSHN